MAKLGQEVAAFTPTTHTHHRNTIPHVMDMINRVPQVRAPENLAAFLAMRDIFDQYENIHLGSYQKDNLGLQKFIDENRDGLALVLSVDIAQRIVDGSSPNSLADILAMCTNSVTGKSMFAGELSDELSGYTSDFLGKILEKWDEAEHVSEKMTKDAKALAVEEVRYDTLHP